MNENIEKEDLKEYSVRIFETRKKYIDIKAKSEEEAIEKVKRLYWSGKIELDDENTETVEFD